MVALKKYICIVGDIGFFYTSRYQDIVKFLEDLKFKISEGCKQN